MVEGCVTADHLRMMCGSEGIRQLVENITDAMRVKWNGDELDDDGRMTLHYMMPCVINPHIPSW